METTEPTHFSYSQVPGEENLLQVSFLDGGKEATVIAETFSEKQFELFERVKKKIDPNGQSILVCKI